MSQDELIDIVDEDGKVLYSISKREAHKKGLLHKTVIGAVKNSKDQILLVKQTPDRQEPGQFVNPVGGHVRSGESEEEALMRETWEEIGLKDIKFELLGRKIFNREILGRNENHYFCVYQITSDEDFKLGSEAESWDVFTPEQIVEEFETDPKKYGNSFKFVHDNFFPKPKKAKTLKVIVGSTNPVKINATKLAFEKVWPDKKWEVVGADISSGVSDQPMNDLEGIKGARNRAKKAMKLSKSDFAVGMEGALQKIGNKWFECGWMVVINKKGNEGLGTSIRINIPGKMMKMVHQGMEMGDVADIIFKRKNIKQQEGFFGAMTNMHITRTKGYEDGIISALSAFINPELFKN